jgi:outer membrane protein TolC
MRSRGTSGYVVNCFAAVASTAFAACQRPLDGDDRSTVALEQSLIESVRREIAALPPGGDREPMTTTQPPSDVEQELRDRLPELEAMAGPDSFAGRAPDLDPDLAGAEQIEVAVTLEEAIHSAVANNLDLQLARIEPAISQAQLAQAEAVFDAVYFARIDHTRLDEPSAVPVLGGFPLGAAVNVREQTVFETGIRQPIVTGGQVTLSTSLERSRNRTPGFALTPDPAYLAAFSLGFDQPLLRGFGSAANLAEIRLTQNQDRRAVQELLTALLDLVFAVEDAYWDLVVARRVLLIRQRLLEEGLDVLETLEARRIREARTEELADARATVERRQADIIRARRVLRAASDRLKQLLNDPSLLAGSEVLLNPVDFMVEAPISWSLRESLLTAIERRPEIHQALLDIDDSSIRTAAADNARLPRLDLSARMDFLGLDDEAGGAYGNAADDTFVDYFIAALFEQPIGNRGGESLYREARLRQSQSVIAYRRAVQDVVLDVKSALRDVVANYELIQAARSARLAQTENIRAMLAREQLQALDPVYLDLKFRRQETLAQSEAEELLALANFNKAVARLYRAMGIGLDMNRIDFDPDSIDD